MLKWWPKIGIALLSAAGLYLAVAVTFANSVAGQAPQLALSVWPGHAAAQTRLARRLVLNNPGAEAIDAAARLSSAALRRDPTLAEAARNLGLQAAIHGNANAASRLMNYSAQMSRRDVPTQLWLLEQHVQRNDVEGALHYYAIVLQIEPNMREPLFQVLASAISHHDLIPPIARMARRGDSWRNGFLTYVVGNASDLRGAASLLFESRRAGATIEPSLPQELIRRMMVQNDVEGAVRTYALVDSRWRSTEPASQLDGGFDIADPVAPFGWTLDPDLASRDVRPGTNGNMALRIAAPTSGRPVVARRMLLLPAGTVQLEGAFGTDESGEAGELHVSLRCGDDRLESEFEAPLRGSGRFSGRLTASQCGRHWLVLSVDPASAGHGQALWVDDLQLRR